jgi:hypothetical protein
MPRPLGQNRADSTGVRRVWTRAGATLLKRDAVDERIGGEVRRGTKHVIELKGSRTPAARRNLRNQALLELLLAE